MYAALWRVLPGPIWIRILFVLILVAAVLLVLDFWVFPFVESLINNQEATVGGQ